MGSFWAGSAGDVHDPAHHGEVAGQGREFDRPGLPETGRGFGIGFVADSVPEKEYQEILQKSKALFEVVEEVENDVVAFR